jgi:hypothetical protein
MTSQAGERRGEPRIGTQGEITLLLRDTSPVPIPAQLMDISSSGFRVSHHYSGLSSGQVVEFRHRRAAGEARVMWSRILQTHVESGFLVLDSHRPDRE